MDMEFMSKRTERNMRDNGKLIINMVKGRNSVIFHKFIKKRD
jgi:hypothetical protein